MGITWETDEQGFVTNGPGTMKTGDLIRIVMPDGGETLVEVTDTPVDEAGTVSMRVRQIAP